MTHYGKLGDMPIKIEVECRHPHGIDNGCCPTKFGQCEDCKHGFAVMPLSHALALVKAAGTTKE